jgi:hypothetical protein
MKIALVQLILTTSVIVMFSDSYSQDWPKVYGDYLMAYGQEIAEVYDNGYLIRGSILKDASHFKFGWLIKIDINGNVLWDKKFGDPSYENFFLDFDKTADNGLIISGATAQEEIWRDPLFVKLDPCGAIEWCKIFLSPLDNHATGVISLPDGTFIGMLEYYGGNAQEIRISLVKMDATGEPIWIKNLAQNDSTIANEEGFYLNLTPDGNYLVSGSCFSPGIKPYFIKTDTAGDQMWDIKWPYGSGGYAGQSVFSSNGMIYNATHLKFPGRPKVPFLIKFDESGSIIDQYPMMGDTIINGGASSLLMFDDTTLYSGTTWTNDPNYEEFNSDIIKTDTFGNIKIQRYLINEDYPPTSITKSFDNKILVIGTFVVGGNWDIYMWKMNEKLEDDTLYTQPMTYDSLCPYQITSDTVALDCGLFVNIDEIPTKEEYESTIKILPNPAREWISLIFPDIVAPGEVELVMYSVFGQKVLRKVAIPANRLISLDISGFHSGIYLIIGHDSRQRAFQGKFLIRR